MAGLDKLDSHCSLRGLWQLSCTSEAHADKIALLEDRPHIDLIFCCAPPLQRSKPPFYSKRAKSLSRPISLHENHLHSDQEAPMPKDSQRTTCRLEMLQDRLSVSQTGGHLCAAREVHRGELQ